MSTKRQATPKINVTKNYRLFARCQDNRPLDLKKHKRLFESMKKYGFLPVFPIICQKVGGTWIVKEGQHRLAFAESLGLSVYWVETDVDFDIAEINDTPKTWQVADYAHTHASNGIAAYQELIDFSESHGLPVGTSASLLAGTTSFGNVRDQYKKGTFRIKDREWAGVVAALYGGLRKISPVKVNKRLVEACMSICRVEGFDIKRMLSNAERCREKLTGFSTRDAYLQALEDIYNFGRSKKFPLKFQAEEAMRLRNIVNGKAD